MTQEDLAGLVGASRERVNKALAMFVRLDWIEATGRSRYRIKDRDQLELAAARAAARAAQGTYAGGPRLGDPSAVARDTRATPCGRSRTARLR